jgi:hypothetical protein
MSEIGKLLIVCGVLLAIVGVFIVLGSRIHLPLGRLPGDIVYRGKNTTFYFPLVTCILISIVVSVILYIVGRLSR